MDRIVYKCPYNCSRHCGKNCVAAVLAKEPERPISVLVKCPIEKKRTNGKVTEIVVIIKAA